MTAKDTNINKIKCTHIGHTDLRLMLSCLGDRERGSLLLNLLLLPLDGLGLRHSLMPIASGEVAKESLMLKSLPIGYGGLGSKLKLLQMHSDAQGNAQLPLN